MGPRGIDTVENALSAAEINYAGLFQGWGFLPVFSCMFFRQLIEGEATTEKEGHGLTQIKGFSI